MDGIHAQLAAPEDGFVAVGANGYWIASELNDHHPGTWANGCTPSSQPSYQAAGWDRLTGPELTINANCGPWTTHYEALFSPLIAERSDGQGLGSFEPYTGQPTNSDPITWWSNTPSTEADLETRTGHAVAEMDEERSLMGQKLAFELGRENACDPVEEFVCNPPNAVRTEAQKRCDLGDGGANADPDPTRTIKQNAPSLYAVHQSFQRRAEGGGSLVPTALKKGWTARHSRTEWAGWGWRHITAKHGWRPADVSATAQALQALPLRKEDRLIYSGPTYELNGEVCHRTVVVAPGPRGEEEPEAPEIITSYGKQGPNPNDR